VLGYQLVHWLRVTRYAWLHTPVLKTAPAQWLAAVTALSYSSLQVFASPFCSMTGHGIKRFMH